MHQLQGVPGGVRGLPQMGSYFLQVPVVALGQGLGYREDGDQFPLDARGFGPGHLRHVGVLLLGHYGAGGGIFIPNFQQTKLVAAPDDEFLADAAEGDTQKGQGRYGFGDEVPAAHRVQGVLQDLGESQKLGGALPVDGKTSGGQGCRAQGAKINPFVGILQSLVIPFKCLGVG